MKLITYLTLLIALVAIPARADNANNQATNPPAQSTQHKTDYKDAFLKFVLDKADKYSGTVENAVGKAVDTIAEETPKIAKEYLVWRAWYHGMKFFIPVMLTIALGVICVISTKKADWDSYNATPSHVLSIFSGILGGVALITSLICLTHLFSLIQVIVSPRIYIIEQVINMMK